MLYLLLKITSCLPLNSLYIIAHLFALLLYLFPSSFKRISRINLKLAYPQLCPKQHKQLLKDTLKSQCFTYIESVKCWGMPTAYNLNLIKHVEGEQLLLDALSTKKGVIIVVTHFGCWEILNVWLNQYAQPMVMYKPNKNKDLDQFIFQARQNFNSILVPTDATGVSAIFKHLKRGGVTLILPDHLPKPSGGVYAKFFEQDVLCSTLVSKLAHKTQCEVIGISCVRQTSGFNIVCQAMHADITGLDLHHSVSVLNQNMQQMINQAPEQYIWSYKRFRRMTNPINVYQKA